MKNSIFLLFISFAFADYTYTISDISKDIEKRMISGNSHKNSCPVSLEDLKYLNLTFINYQGKEEIGELIVSKTIVNNAIETFRELYDIKYPINSMKLVSNFNASDFDSIEANNTSAYNCRYIANTKKWSNHAFGKAIDINPIENPYISRSGKIFHEESLKYRDRVRTSIFEVSQNAMLLKNDKAVKIFKKNGWIWGGDWKSIKDYQHFEIKK